MNAIVEKSLILWGLSGAEYTLVAARENAVYKVNDGTQSFALRLHRQGYRTDDELWSELQWMYAAHQGNIEVPTPVTSTSGYLLHVIDDIQVDVLTWLSGTTMDEAMTDLPPPERANLFQRLGREMARLHNISDAWAQPDGFIRCSWDRDGLLGAAPIWGRFWENPALTTDERHLFLAMRDKANSELSSIEPSLDRGLIHADLVAANVMVVDGTIQLIDFDDGGFGFRMFDIATALLKHRNATDYAALRAALISGYTATRAIDFSTLDFFILLRAVTYVGWNILRMGEDPSTGRNARFIYTAKQLATTYLKT